MGFSVFSDVRPSLLIFNTDIFLVTFVWIKEKANAKGNGDWHLRKSRFAQKRYEEIFICRHLLRRFLVPFDFSARVCGEKILNMQRGFSFPRVAGNLPRKGPLCFLLRTVL